MVINEVTALKAEHSHTQKDVTELRTDMRAVLERLTRLEVKVEHLPSKGFIVAVVTSCLAIGAALVTILPRLTAILSIAPK